MKIKYYTLLLLAGIQIPTNQVNAQGYTCRACSAGSYSADGKKCVPCPAGTVTTTTGKASCSKCSAGTYTSGATTGNSACTTCEAGYACAGGNSRTQCTGTTYATAGSSACKSCGANVASCDNKTGAVTKCNTGYYKNGNACTQCQAGYRCPDGVNRYYCSAGTYNTSVGQTACSNCGVGYYCTGGTARSACSVSYGGWSGSCGNVSRTITSYCQAQNSTYATQGPTVSRIENGNVGGCGTCEFCSTKTGKCVKLALNSRIITERPGANCSHALRISFSFNDGGHASCDTCGMTECRNWYKKCIRY